MRPPALLLAMTMFLCGHGALAQALPYHVVPSGRVLVPNLGPVPTIRFLTTADFPPFNYRDDKGELIGFNVDLARSLCDELKLTCTIQACNLRDHYSLLQQNGFKVIGISPDDEKSHQKFREKFQLPFTLLADPQHKIIDKYGVWGPKKLYGRDYMGLYRTTFVIDEKGIIRKIFLRPRNKAHAEEIVSKWKEVSP